LPLEALGPLPEDFEAPEPLPEGFEALGPLPEDFEALEPLPEDPELGFFPAGGSAGAVAPAVDAPPDGDAADAGEALAAGAEDDGAGLAAGAAEAADAGGPVGAGAVVSVLAGATVPATGVVAAAAAVEGASAAHAALPFPCPELHEPSAIAKLVVTAPSAAENSSAPAIVRPSRGACRRKPTRPWLTTASPRTRLELRLSVGRATCTDAETTPPGGAKKAHCSDRQ
jgi:hypothetical protein